MEARPESLQAGTKPEWGHPGWQLSTRLLILSFILGNAEVSGQTSEESL